MFRQFKFRLWTNANQERELAATLETHRRLYNAALYQRIESYKSSRISVSYFDQSKWLTQERRNNPYLARVNAASAEQTLRRLDSAFGAFFRRVKSGDGSAGHPRFKPRDRFNSFSFRCVKGYPDGFGLVGKRLRLQHIGMIRVCLHREILGTIKGARVLRDGNRWFVVLICECASPPPKSPVLPPVGIDVGIESFLTTSNGRHEPNPRYLKTALPRLRVAGRAVSRKKPRGANRRKAVVRLQKTYCRVRNLRREHHHQVACRLVRAHGLVAVERLNIQGMLKNGRLARAISDAGWYGFLNILRCKAESAGVQFVEVDARGTSQQCTCGHEVRKELKVRWHYCPACGLSLHRDHVSAQVILARGLARTEPAGVNVGHETKRPRRSRRVIAVE